MILRIVSLALTLSACPVWSADPPPPGGKGDYTMNNQCLDTGSRLVPQVCADITFHYELSAFMGEPLAHYGLIWRLRYFTVKGGRSFSGDEARSLFGAAADRIALMVQGTAEVRQKSGVRLTLPNIDVIGENPSFLVVDIDSGVATRAGKMSWNIAGSPDWSKFLMYPAGGECAGGMGDAHAATNTGIRKYASSATAKAVMKTGNLELSGRNVCRKGTLVEGLEDLESAIVKICQPKSVTKGAPNKPYSWCPDIPIPGAALTDMLDDMGSQPLVEAKLNELRAAHLEKVEEQCEADFGRIKACYAANGCAPKSDEEIKQCQVRVCGQRPAEKVCDGTITRKCRPSNSMTPLDRGWAGGNRLCLTYDYDCDGSYIDNPEMSGWKHCAGNAIQCQASDACIARCNPGKYSNVADCVKKTKYKGAPTEADARALVKQAQQAKPAPRKPNQPTSFLD